MRKLLTAVGIATLVAGNVFIVTAQGQKDDKVPGQYIVVFKDSVENADDATNDLEKTHGLGVSHRYGHALKGFAGTIPDHKLEKIKNDPRVQFISEDRTVEANKKPVKPPQPQPSQQLPNGVKRTGANLNANKGAGVVIAVIDTGIDTTHPDLAGNIISSGKTCVTGTTSAKDDNGHGSHVAGTIAAVDNGAGVVGIAPQAKLVPVKVLNANGSGTWSSVICGIDWVTANASSMNIKVANMSLGGGGSSDNNCGLSNNDAMHKAICNSVAKGVTYVVAAGNENANTANSTPAAYNDAVITVSALADSDGAPSGTGAPTSYGPDDTFATFSNFGTAVDIGAPGVAIYSTWKDGGYNTISGTSMAAPHVAGAAALYIKSHPGALWTQVRDALIATGEGLNAGHTDPSGLHSEKVLRAASL